MPMTSTSVWLDVFGAVSCRPTYHREFSALRHHTL
jgi:hypothetical protein